MILSLRGEIYEKLKSYTISSVPQKIKNIHGIAETGSACV